MSKIRMIIAGGVAAYVHESLCSTIIHHSRVNTLTETDFQALKIVEKISKLPVSVVIVHRHPRRQVSYKVLDFFASQAQSLDNLILISDFNAHIQSKFLI